MTLVRPGKPAAAFLGPKRHHGQVSARHEPRTAHRVRDRQPRHHASRTVIIAAVGDSIQVRPGHPARRLALRTGQCHDEGARAIHANLQIKLARSLRHQVVRPLLALAITRAQDRSVNGGDLPEQIKERRTIRGALVPGGRHLGVHVRYRLRTAHSAARFRCPWRTTPDHGS